MSRRAPTDELVVFLGPSLPVAEAIQIAPATFLPPARQGDLWRALSRRPVAIALIDGVFESQPSVWHREILAAQEAGVTVFGGSSMGALRAAELWTRGMIGVGRIFRDYRDGVLEGDDEVALLHAGPEHGHRAFTVPLVNVRYAAEQAREAGVLTRRQERRVVDAACGLFYQHRTWPDLLDVAGLSRSRPAFERFLAKGGLDLKRLDAIECLKAAAEFVRARRGQRTEPAAPTVPSSLVRRRRLLDGQSRARLGAVPNAEVLEALSRRPEADELIRAGLTRKLLAGWARELGLRASRSRIRRAEAAWRSAAGFGPTKRDQFFATSGLDAGTASALLEELALAELLLDHAPRLLSDGPSPLEALADQARILGLWAETTRRLARPRRR